MKVIYKEIDNSDYFFVLQGMFYFHIEILFESRRFAH